jgi:hypothetical protein
MDKNNTKEIIFFVEDEPEDGYIAKAIGESIGSIPFWRKYNLTTPRSIEFTGTPSI